jgi:hypothetical protein
MCGVGGKRVSGYRLAEGFAGETLCPWRPRGRPRPVGMPRDGLQPGWDAAWTPAARAAATPIALALGGRPETVLACLWRRAAIGGFTVSLSTRDLASIAKYS